ncbi:MAG: 2-oxoglutarate ferredoxin oxidoreductase subunit alpha [Verrucomicrobiales bacterium]|jgi:2-oxoglutarate ferredoxin oxidoreductase subunit alpha
MSEVTSPEAQAVPGRAGLKSESVDDAVIRLAGDSQDGIQSVGGMLARLAGRTDQDVITYMTIPSTISGGPSIFQVRLGSGEVLSPGDRADFLVAFYQHSYESHIEFLREGGICLYDSDHVEPNLDDARFRFVGVPMTSATVEAIGGGTKDRGKNMFSLGLICSIFDLDRAKLARIIESQFKGKHESIVRNALLAFDAGYGYSLGDLLEVAFEMKEGQMKQADRVATDGNTALTQGLLAAGVRFGAGYPITPWSSIMEQLRIELPRFGGLFIQTEDELAAVSMALGFAYSGHLAVTGSSGPGISLKMEALSWGTMAELPLIVVNVQRGGPSTGLPTSVEQSDLMQAIYGSHGDTPRVVLAPKDVEDCFYIALEAARIAKKFSVPVFILSDQALATRIEAFEMPKFDEVVTDPELDLSNRNGDFKPYPLEGQTKHAPPGTIMEGGKYPVVTGLEHDEWGHPTANPELHQKMNARRRNKLRSLEAELETPEVYGDSHGEVLLVGWGSTWGPIREATDHMRSKHRTAGAVHLRHIHPMAPGLEAIFNSYRRICVVEMNDEGVYGQGQLATLLRSRFADPKIKSVCKTDGLNFRVREIVARVDEITGATTKVPMKASQLTNPVSLRNPNPAV